MAEEGMRVYCDMDGVLANLVRGLCKKYKIKAPKGQLIPQDFPAEDIGGSFSTIFNDLEKETSDFWTNLQPFDHTDQILRLIRECAPRDYYFLSSVVLTPACHYGKAEWIRRNIGRDALQRLILCCGNKSFACQPGDILIDDRRDHCNDWQLAGGKAFLWKEYSDDCTEWYTEQFESLREFLEGAKELEQKESMTYA